MKKIIALALITLLSLTASACQEETPDDLVYVTNYPTYFLVETIGDGIVNTKYVPGAQAHAEHHDWSANEIIAMQDAELLFYVGAGLDPYIDRNVDSVFEGQDVELVRFEDYIDIIEVKIIHDHDHNDHHDHNDDHHDDDHDHDEAELMPDPHFWLDVGRMLEAAEIVRDYLIDAYPEKDTQLNNNFLPLKMLLEQLDNDYKELLSGKDKPLITNVNLFSYFEEAYGADIRPFTLQAHAHENEPVPTDFTHFVDLAIEEDIQYILFEKNANSPAGEALLSEIQSENPDVEKQYLHPIGFLTDEELDDRENYITMMYYNLEVLNKALE